MKVELDNMAVTLGIFLGMVAMAILAEFVGGCIAFCS
ncbi:hypothetical protein LCGC14_0918310 [marine sediment metagenome]|uniref:Uncharacterized protein n=1 Tax=marine sediment metagenome TaxID=412755 RepID=A0A0F9NWC8_9ZZZZ